MPKRLTQEEFIERTKLIFGDKYNYTHVDYINSATKVNIFCKKCNENFEIIPNNHLKGFGCPRCANEEFKKRRRDKYIEEVRKVYGDKYTVLNFEDTRKDVEVLCKKHGIFKKNAKSFKDGHKCPECRKEELETLKEKTKIKNDEIKSKIEKEKQERKEKIKRGEIKPVGNGSEMNLYYKFNYIKEAKAVFGDRFDYSKTVYEKKEKKVIINCKRHGDFKILPLVHLMGQKCKRCASEEAAQKNKQCQAISKEEAITKFKKAHGNEYDYSQVEYVNKNTKVKIICREHGEFWQKPRIHWAGSRCPICAKTVSKHELIVLNWAKENNVNIERRMVYPDLKDILPLSYDFYLPEYNLLIECNGRQHYEPVQFNGKTIEEAKEDFEIQKRHDKLKEEYARNNKINLLIISYKEIDDTEKILNEKLLEKAA